MKRIEKIKQLETFFKSGGLKKTETKIVFRVTANGEPVEPAMNEQEFNLYVEELKTEYSSIFVLYEHKQYER
jgi:hypothetical protein